MAEHGGGARVRVVAILSLALGIGANTAIFSLWNGVLRAPLPRVHKPEQLVMLSNPDDSGSGPAALTAPVLAHVRRIRATARPRRGLLGTHGIAEQPRNLAGPLRRWRPEETARTSGVGRLFQVLGVPRDRPALHRGRRPPRARRRHQLRLLAATLRRSSGRAGQDHLVRKVALTIIGVAPPGFIGETSGQQPDLWLPLRMQPSVLPGNDRLHDTPPEKRMWLHVFGRLKPGVTLAQAESRANAIFQAGLESFYGAAASGDAAANSWISVSRSGRARAARRRRAMKFSQSLTALLAAVGVLLLIACANLANLLLARGAARKPEIALRLSLGASRGRLIRQLVTESLALAAMGGVAALAVASVLSRRPRRNDGAIRPAFPHEFRPGPACLAFSCGDPRRGAVVRRASGLAGHEATPEPASRNRPAARDSRQMRSGQLLVSLQLALSLPLLVGAGLLARTVLQPAARRPRLSR